MKGHLPKYLLLLADLLAIVLAFRAAYFLRYECGFFPSVPGIPTPAFAAYESAILLALGTWVVIFFVYGANHFPGLGEAPLAAAKLITASVFLIASLLAGMYLARTYYSRLLFSFLSVLVVLFLLFTRVMYQFLLKRLRKYGLGLRRVVIVGHSELAAELAERIGQRLDLHYELVGHLAPTAGRLQGSGNLRNSSDGEHMCGSEAMARVLAARKVDELLFAIPIRRETETLDFIAHCQRMGMTIKCVPEYYDLHTSNIERLSIDGIPILEMKETALHPSRQAIKRVIDLVLAVALVPVVVPLSVLIGIILYLGSGRVIKGVPRIGLAGKTFILYHFDISFHDRGATRLIPAWCLKFARFLGRYSLAELPQIWNVIRGNMSFVGPQPESPEQVRHYSAWHKRRLQIKPGITGLAQVKGLRETDSSDLKTKFDLEYAANYTPLVDLALVLATFSTLIARRRAREPNQVFPHQVSPGEDPIQIL